jgi:hypothetical protein
MHNYHNGIGIVAYATIATVSLLLVPIFFLTGIIRLWGWGFITVLIAVMVLVGVIMFSFFGFPASVTFGDGWVILWAPFRRLRMRREEVDNVELVPRAETLSPDWSFFDVQSRMTIHMENGRIVVLSMMPDGLKRRIAQTLDPAHWPPLPEPQQE